MLYTGHHCHWNRCCRVLLWSCSIGSVRCTVGRFQWSKQSWLSASGQFCCSNLCKFVYKQQVKLILLCQLLYYCNIAVYTMDVCDWLFLGKVQTCETISEWITGQHPKLICLLSRVWKWYLELKVRLSHTSSIVDRSKSQSSPDLYGVVHIY